MNIDGVTAFLVESDISGKTKEFCDKLILRIFSETQLIEFLKDVDLPCDGKIHLTFNIMPEEGVNAVKQLCASEDVKVVVFNVAGQDTLGFDITVPDRYL